MYVTNSETGTVTKYYYPESETCEGESDSILLPLEEGCDRDFNFRYSCLSDADMAIESQRIHDKLQL